MFVVLVTLCILVAQLVSLLGKLVASVVKQVAGAVQVSLPRPPRRTLIVFMRIFLLLYSLFYSTLVNYS